MSIQQMPSETADEQEPALLPELHTDDPVALTHRTDDKRSRFAVHLSEQVRAAGIDAENHVEVDYDPEMGAPTLIIGDAGPEEPDAGIRSRKLSSANRLIVPRELVVGDGQFSLGIDPEAYDDDNRLLFGWLAMDGLIVLQAIGYENEIGDENQTDADTHAEDAATDSNTHDREPDQEASASTVEHAPQTSPVPAAVVHEVAQLYGVEAADLAATLDDVADALREATADQTPQTTIAPGSTDRPIPDSEADVFALSLVDWTRAVDPVARSETLLDAAQAAHQTTVENAVLADSLATETPRDVLTARAPVLVTK